MASLLALALAGCGVPALVPAAKPLPTRVPVVATNTAVAVAIQLVTATPITAVVDSTQAEHSGLSDPGQTPMQVSPTVQAVDTGGKPLGTTATSFVLIDVLFGTATALGRANPTPTPVPPVPTIVTLAPPTAAPVTQTTLAPTITVQVVPTMAVQKIVMPTDQNTTQATMGSTVAAVSVTGTPAPTMAVQKIVMPTDQGAPQLTPVSASIPATPVPSLQVGVQSTSQATATGSVVGTDPLNDPLAAQGKIIFEKTAGGVGCQYCHGMDARGKIGPNIRGKSPQAIKQALGTVVQMSIVHLTDQEIQAVSAYLRYLASQP